MKKNLFFKLLLLVALTLSISCQPDDEQTAVNKPKAGITSKIINFDQFKANTKALKELEKRHREQSFRKTIYDSSGFYYNEDYVLNIYYKDYTTYTIPIYRETESRFVENLVIREKSTGEIDSYIFSYDLTEQERSDLTNNYRIENLQEKLQVKNSVEGGGDGDYFIRIDGKCYTYHSSYIVNGEEEEGVLVERECPEEDPDLSYTQGPDPGSGNSSGGFPINIVIAYPPTNPGGPVSGPGGGGGGAPNPIFSPDPVITRPFVNILVEMFNNDLMDNELDKFVWLKQHMQIRMGINSLLSGLLDGYETRKELAHRIIDLAMEDEANVEVAQQILDYLDEEDNSDESIEYTQKVIDYLNEYTSAESKVIAQEVLILLNEFEETEPEDRMALNMTMETFSNGYLENPFDNNYYTLIDSYTEVNLQGPEFEIWKAYFTAQCAILRHQHPEWSTARVYWEASREMLHLALDIIGLVPVVGEVADLANGVIYTIEGDGVNATLSFAATIPIGGWAATGIKYAKRTINITSSSQTTLKWIKNTQNIITFGDRGQLRKVLNLASGDPRQAHHIIPWGKGSHPAVQKAAGSEDALHLNEAINGIPLNPSVHSGSHAIYDANIQARLDAIPANATPQEAYDEILDIIHDIKTAIYNNPNTHVNNLIF